MNETTGYPTAGSCAAAGSACICSQWCQVENHRVALLTGHHPNCQQAKPALDAAIDLIRRLVHGMQDWGADEDGIHPAAWDAYKHGKAVIGEFDWKDESPNATGSATEGRQ